MLSSLLCLPVPLALGCFSSLRHLGEEGGAGDCCLPLGQVDQGSCWARVTSPEDFFPFSFGQIVPVPKVRPQDRAGPGALPLWACVRIFAWALPFLLSILPFPLCHGRCQRHPSQPVFSTCCFHGEIDLPPCSAPLSPIFSKCLASALAALPWFMPSSVMNPLARPV